MPGDPLTFWLVFFQLAAGIVLAFRKGEPRLPVRILAAMLLLNAGVTAIWFQSFWPPWDPGRRVAAALDAPTEMLAFAFLASLAAGAWARRATWLFLGLAVVMGAVAPFMYPHPSTSLSRGFEMLRHALYFVGLGLVVFRLAQGRATWEWWAALAFLPRAFYWGAAGLPTVLGVVEGTAQALDTIMLLTVPFLLAMALLAQARLLRGEGPLGAMAMVLVPLSGVAIWAAEMGVRSLQADDPILVPMLSLLTLGLHRPLFLVLGLAPGMLAAVAGRATVSAVVGSVALLGLEAFYPGASTAAAITGFVAGAMALAVLEVLWPRLESWEHREPWHSRPHRGLSLHFGQSGFALMRHPAAPSHGPGPVPSGAPAGASTASPAPRAGPAAAAPPAGAAGAASTAEAPSRGLPQWQELLLALRGTSLASGEAPRGEAALTQKALVERTGIRASRVSTLIRELNDGAERRLDGFAPGWRSLEPRPLEPAIVQQFRGHVPGQPGVWVYYRLTPQGEMLAEALERAGPQAGDADPRARDAHPQAGGAGNPAPAAAPARAEGPGAEGQAV